jgi:hypothetical protein
MQTLPFKTRTQEKQEKLPLETIVHYMYVQYHVDHLSSELFNY